MSSPLGLLSKALRILPWNQKYWGNNGYYQPSSCDHIGCGLIYALATYPYWWAFLGTWVWHCVIVELVWDTWWKKKNLKQIAEGVHDVPGAQVIFSLKSKIDWNAVIAQMIERSIGHLIILPVLIWSLFNWM